MRGSATLALLVALVFLAACASPAEKAAEAQERMANSQNELIQERLRLTEEHEKCVDKAGSDQVKMAKCDQILNRIQALH
jgi:uncharacterized lipoprotein YajG